MRKWRVKMIPIKYPGKTVMAEIKYEYKNIFGDTSKKNIEFYSLCEREKKKLGKYKKLSIEDLLVMPFDEIAKMAPCFRESNIPNVFESLKEILVYTPSHQRKISNLFMRYADKLKISSCYFCNIDYVNVFEVKKNSFKNNFTLDHMLSKAKNPLFSLSFYNFIPSCYTCNSKLKRDFEFIDSESEAYLSPSSKDFSFDENVEFKVFLNSEKDDFSFKDVKCFDMKLVDKSGNDKYKLYIEKFYLEERYQFHKNTVKEIILKLVKYGGNGKDSYLKDFNKSDAEFIKDMMGREIFEGELNSRSLTKLKRDIYLAFKKS